MFLRLPAKTLVPHATLLLLTFVLRAYEGEAGVHRIQDGSVKLPAISGEISGPKVTPAGGPSILRLKAAPIRAITRCILASPLSV
jgi:hypothetical protein